MAGLKVSAKTSQKISIGADTFRLKVLSHIIIVEATTSGGKGKNPVAMTKLSILGKNIGQAGDQTRDLLFLISDTLLTAVSTMILL